MLETLSLPNQINLELVQALLKPATSFVVGTSHEAIKTELSERELSYQCHEIQKSRCIKYSIAKTESNLALLVSAETHYEKGIAYGYPSDACQAFCERRDAHFFKKAISCAIQAKKEVPLWLAYISHVPSKLDIVQGSVAKTSERQGIMYQQFIRTNHPLLAERLETEFAKRLELYQKGL